MCGEVIFCQDVSKYDDLQDTQVIGKLVTVVLVYKLGIVITGSDEARLSGPAALGTTPNERVQC